MLRSLVKSTVLVLLAMGIFAGCNTMRGVGRDVERGWERGRDAVWRR